MTPALTCVLVCALGALGAAQEPATDRIVIWGNTAALCADDTGTTFRTDRVLKAFVDEVERLQPVVVFGLGHHTVSDDAAEWTAVQQQLARIRAARYLVRGERDPIDLPDWTGIAGGAGDRIVDIERIRFILLAPRNVFDTAALAWLDRALAGHRERTATLVLMQPASFFDEAVDSAPADVDATAAGSGYGNWNTDVAPRLRGAATAVICGDEDLGFVRRYGSPEGVDYLCCGFRGRGLGVPFFLELRVRDGELVDILPRTIPLDVRDDWYRHEPGGAHLLRSAQRGNRVQREAALDRMLAQSLAAEDWGEAARMLRVYEKYDLRIGRLGIARRAHGCWSLGLGPQGWVAPGQTPVLLLTNDRDDARVIRAEWAVADGSTGRMAYGPISAEDDWTPVQLPAVVELRVPPHARIAIGFRSDVDMRLAELR